MLTLVLFHAVIWGSSLMTTVSGFSQLLPLHHHHRQGSVGEVVMEDAFFPVVCCSQRLSRSNAATPPSKKQHFCSGQQQLRRQRVVVLYNNFFKNMLENAFDNDPRFSESVPSNNNKNKRLGQIDYQDDDDDDDLQSLSSRRRKATIVQEQWRRQQQQVTTPDAIVNTRWKLDLYLAGVPLRDPSNDLFASRETISSRDRALGIQIPNAPTLSIEMTLAPNQLCAVSSSDFTTDSVPGQWKLSDDGKQLRFSIQTLGYSRTVETKGSIQNIYGIAWKRDRLYETTAKYGDSSSNNESQSEQEQPVQQLNQPTSSVYAIPPGWIYADVQVTRSSSSSNKIQMVPGTGVLRLEQTRGWIGSVMVPCGKFTAVLLDLIFQVTTKSRANKTEGSTLGKYKRMDWICHGAKWYTFCRIIRITKYKKPQDEGSTLGTH